jgi:hypothetical protein
MKHLELVTYVGMHFTEQKNGIKNETIGLTHSRDQTACPVLMAIQHVHHLCEHHMPSTNPLFLYLNNHTEYRITDRMVTDHLRL